MTDNKTIFSQKKQDICIWIIDKINEFVNIDEFLASIVKKTGRSLKADRCVISLYDDNSKQFYFKSSYLSDKSIKPVSNEQILENILTEQRRNLINKGKIIVINDVNSNLNNDIEKNYFKVNNIKSLIIAPLYNKGAIIGTLALHRIKIQEKWSVDYINILKDITNLIAAAIGQINLSTNFEKLTEKERNLNKITEIIRSTLDINKVFDLICEKVSELFNVERVSIIEFLNKNNKQEKKIRREYSIYDTEKKLEDIEYDKLLGEYWTTKLSYYNNNLIINDIPDSDVPDNFKQVYNELGIKSVMAVPIKKGTEIWGMITLSTKDFKNWTTHEENLLQTISDQIYISIKQAESYTATKKYAEREATLRKIIETIRSSLDINETLTIICDEVAKLFNVKRATIVEFPNANNYEEYIIRREFKLIPEIKGLDSIEYDKRTVAYWAGKALGEEVNLIIDNISESETPDYFKSTYKALGIKSVLGFPIRKGGNCKGVIVLSEYDYYRHWNEDEINLLETISDQVYSAIKQAELYTATKKYAEREATLRKIVETIRSSLDINETLTIICDEVAKLFNVQRATIVEFPNPHNYEEYLIRSEYKIITEIKGLNCAGYEKKTAAYWAIKTLEESVNLIIDNIPKSNTPDYFKRSYEALGVKSIFGFPIKRGEDTWGTFVLSEYNYYRHWTEEELNLLETIAGQTYIAINQAELYSTTKKQAERERALYQSVNIIRSTLNINKIKQTFIIEAAKLFQADRSFIIEFDSVNNKLLPVNKNLEYLSSPDIKSFVSPYIKYPFTLFDKIISEKKEIILKDAEKYLQKNHPDSKLIGKLLKKFNIKSCIAFPLFYANKVFGILVIQHTNKKVIYRNEDIEFIRALASQVSIAFYQSQLYSSIETSEKYTKFILNGIKEGVIALNEEYTIESCNQETGNIFGYPVSEIKGKSISLLIPQLIMTNNKLAIKKDNHRVILPNATDFELIGLKKSGKNFPLEVSINKILFEKKLKFLFVVRDITERKKIEQMKNEFISTVSHELRTPLTSMQGSLELILSKAFGELPKQIHNLTNITYKNSIRLTHLINDLLDIEKIEIGKMQFNMEFINLVQVIKEAIEANKAFAEKFNVKFIFNYDKKNIKVNVDKYRLIQVITNLLSNAAKFSPPDDIVTISMSNINNNMVRIAVSDNGPGIPEEFISRIFQKFSQADSSDTRQKGGTGLGLSISKAIIEKMNGNIGFTTELNRGSTFYFDLPEVNK